MTAFYRTSHLPRHGFVDSEFWSPWCGLCHEKHHHPIHSAENQGKEIEVCGYDACEFCGIESEPGRGVPDRKKG